MTKARKAIAEAMPSQDVILEVLDARMPHASENPVVTELRGSTPCVKILSKSDLADPLTTAAWLSHLRRTSDTKTGREGATLALAIEKGQPGSTRAKILQACAQLNRRQRKDRPLRAMVVGIPNVGKSTLLNTLMGRKVAKVGDEPAVTKAEQLATLSNGMQISDNPGILWPKIEDPRAALCLAFGGAIPSTAMDYEIVGTFGACELLVHYPQLVVSRFGLDHVPADAAALLLEVGKRRGCVRAGGVVDLHKAAEALVREFRSGGLGRISLERPEDADPCVVAG